MIYYLVILKIKYLGDGELCPQDLEVNFNGVILDIQSMLLNIFEKQGNIIIKLLLLFIIKTRLILAVI